jgi:hypothetical protein
LDQMNVKESRKCTKPEDVLLDARSSIRSLAAILVRATGRHAIILCFVAAALGSCASFRSGGSNYSDEGTNSATDAAANAYPASYKSDLLAFLRTYLNDPTRVRDASIAEPALKPMGRTNRYVVCLRYNARKVSGEYGGPKESAAVYIGGKFNQLVEAKGEVCAGAVYQPFPELEHLTRE